jgi:hypothetical protein
MLMAHSFISNFEVTDGRQMKTTNDSLKPGRADITIKLGRREWFKIVS